MTKQYSDTFNADKTSGGLSRTRPPSFLNLLIRSDRKEAIFILDSKSGSKTQLFGDLFHPEAVRRRATHFECRMGHAKKRLPHFAKMSTCRLAILSANFPLVELVLNSKLRFSLRARLSGFAYTRSISTTSNSPRCSVIRSPPQTTNNAYLLDFCYNPLRMRSRARRFIWE